LSLDLTLCLLITRRIWVNDKLDKPRILIYQ
jgi:hypothetical protein